MSSIENDISKILKIDINKLDKILPHRYIGSKTAIALMDNKMEYYKFPCVLSNARGYEVFNIGEKIKVYRMRSNWFINLYDFCTKLKEEYRSEKTNWLAEEIAGLKLYDSTKVITRNELALCLGLSKQVSCVAYNDFCEDNLIEYLRIRDIKIKDYKRFIDSLFIKEFEQKEFVPKKRGRKQGVKK